MANHAIHAHSRQLDIDEWFRTSHPVVSALLPQHSQSSSSQSPSPSQQQQQTMAPSPSPSSASSNGDRALVKLDIGSGFGDWVRARALTEGRASRWIAMEQHWSRIRHTMRGHLYDMERYYQSQQQQSSSSPSLPLPLPSHAPIDNLRFIRGDASFVIKVR